MNDQATSKNYLDGLVAVVTGAAQGLGLGMAERLARDGANVIIADLQSDQAAVAAGQLRQAGLNVSSAYLDVSDSVSVSAFFDTLVEEYGRLDILVNNAGVNYRVPVLEYPEEEWDRVINTNLKGYFLVTRAVAPQMIENGYGKVINMSSILGTVGLPHQVAYASSKGGVDQMTKVMALEWAKLGVRVNAIGPTYFETELVTQIRQDPERFKFINERTPMGRWGHLPELEGIIMFLASPASDFITGQTIYVDGGWTVW